MGPTESFYYCLYESVQSERDWTSSNIIWSKKNKKARLMFTVDNIDKNQDFCITVDPHLFPDFVDIMGKFAYLLVFS